MATIPEIKLGQISCADVFKAFSWRESFYSMQAGEKGVANWNYVQLRPQKRPSLTAKRRSCV